MHAARRLERNVSFGGFVGVEKKRKCFWKAVYALRDMVWCYGMVLAFRSSC